MQVRKKCQYIKWTELNSNYDKTDSSSTSTVWKYTSDYKYTCFSHASVINNSDRSKTISCKITEEIMGVIESSNTPKDNQAKIKYYGLFSPSYESSTTNKTYSVIKTVVDKWYKENIYDKNVESYIVNQVFCNDRSLADLSWNGDGYSWTKNTIYKPYYRVNNLKQPSLMCINQNDKITLKVDSLSSIKGTSNYGNNALNYPVGLITVDEVMLAGGLSGLMNSKYYINTGGGYGLWTVSPSLYNIDFVTSSVWYVDLSGNIFRTRPHGKLKSRTPSFKS